MKHCGSVRSRLTLAFGARTPENPKIDLSSPSSLDSLLRRAVQHRFLIGRYRPPRLPGDASRIVAAQAPYHGRVKQFV
jgi:hypothetical protein